MQLSFNIVARSASIALIEVNKSNIFDIFIVNNLLFEKAKPKLFINATDEPLENCKQIAVK